ncbi:MAG: short chain dehydrogenase [Spirochaetaceae bacterium]|nr:MAG: short chain dehydrogenase [Spirochaetaceae bacterium]
MKILVVGASGTIGRAVVGLLQAEHDVLQASRSGEITLDIENADSIRAAFARVSPLDAIVVAAGSGPFARLDDLKEADFYTAIRGKLMGQVNVVRLARGVVRENGSITLTSGILSHSPWPGSAPIAMVNGALESFVRAAAVDRKGLHRINAVCPPLIAETARKRGMSEQGVSARDVAKVYVEAVVGDMSGKVLTGTWA